jgi:6-phosphofructokinase 1
VEVSSRIIEKAYSFSHSFQNGISLIKLHGYTSGFLASYAVLSTVNSNICLVPEFEFDLYGPKGLLMYTIFYLGLLYGGLKTKVAAPLFTLKEFKMLHETV